MEERHLTRSAVILMLIGEGERGIQVLLQLRQNTGYADGWWDFSASGHVDAGESMKMAAMREAHEELGIGLAAEDVHFATLTHKGGSEVYYNGFFWASVYGGEPRIMEPHKCGGLRWFPLSQLPQNLIPNRRRALENWRAGMPYSEEGWA